MAESRWRRWARSVLAELRVWRLVAVHPRTPRLAKALALLALAYAASPVDLIPDFIPGLGQLDDVLLVPLLLALAARLVPAEVWTECRAAANADSAARPEEAP